MFHPKTMEWDNRMKEMFDRIDRILEERYGGRWNLRRNRPERGATSNPEADGLFNVGAVFTPGYGSELGRGYLVDIVLASEEKISPEAREEIEQFVRDLLSEFLPVYFPDRKLSVDRDGSRYKIHGETGLGKA